MIMGSSMRSTATSILFYVGFLMMSFATFHFCFCNGSSNNTRIICMETEKQALLKFKQDLKDPSNRLSSWGAGNDCCQWAGVVCDNFTGHVREIRLRNPFASAYYYSTEAEYEGYLASKLGGKLNPSLLDLKQLRHLDLSCNGFEGIHIPSFIGSLASLRYLNLSRAEFSETIPHHLGNLSMMRYLGLGGGYYPALHVDNLQWISGLHLLQYLDMGWVNLSKALDWLQVMNALPSLVELHLSGCDLKHVSPTTTSIININFTSLAILDLSRNYLISSVPGWIFSLNRLVSLDISYCNIYGSVLSGLQNMTSLRVLDASFNGLNSSLPKGLFSLSGLISLRLGYNNFQEPIPIGLLNMTGLRELHLQGNSFNSTLPNWLYSFSHLESLNLGFNRLQGVISSAIENLTNSLISLDLSFNQLEGRIPTSLGKLCNLKEIALSGNKFGREVAEVFKSFSRCMLDGLEFVELKQNYLLGHLPEEVSQLKNLASLSLRNNSISGPIPVSIGRLSSLIWLDLSYNELNGTLPQSLGQLTKLEELYISHNLLKGVINSDVCFANLTRLFYLVADGNNLTLKASDTWVPPFQLRYLVLSLWQLGPQFPLWLQSQKELLYLNIANTGLSASIPTWFSVKFSHLLYLNLSHNQIRGEIPRIPEFVPLYSTIDLSSNYLKGPLPLIPSYVTWLDLSNNSFSGSMYHFLCGRVVKPNELGFLNLGNNLLSGRIPDCWKHWRSLDTIKLENNNLMGTIPHSMGHLPLLRSLHLRHNHLSGELPWILQYCTYLKIIDLSENEFIGNIPAWIGNSFSQLIVLNLRSNKFQDDIPYELCRLGSLQILDLAHNNLSGPLPRCFNNFTAMAEKQNSTGHISYGGAVYGLFLDYAFLVIKGREVEYSTTLQLVTSMDLSENNLSGEIPEGLTRLAGLLSLNLSRNRLTGRMPKNIGDMGSLESLDFSQNQLCGEIPLSMSSLTFLSHLNLSYNNLTGRIPSSTQLQSLNESSFVGNKLCGPPLANCSTSRATPNVEHGGDQEREGFPEDLWFFACMALGFVVGFWAVLGPLLFNMSWRIAYFRLLNGVWYKLSNVTFKCRFMFCN